MPRVTKFGKGGRIVIPAEYRRALDLHAGDEVVIQLEDGEVRLFTLRHAIERAQALVRQYAPGARSRTDGLIAERRAEAERAR